MFHNITVLTVALVSK